MRSTTLVRIVMMLLAVSIPLQAVAFIPCDQGDFAQILDTDGNLATGSEICVGGDMTVDNNLWVGGTLGTNGASANWLTMSGAFDTCERGVDFGFLAGQVNPTTTDCISTHTFIFQDSSAPRNLQRCQDEVISPLTAAEDWDTSSEIATNLGSDKSGTAGKVVFNQDPGFSGVVIVGPTPTPTPTATSTAATATPTAVTPTPTVQKTPNALVNVLEVFDAILFNNGTGVTTHLIQPRTVTMANGASAGLRGGEVTQYGAGGNYTGGAVDITGGAGTGIAGGGTATVKAGAGFSGGSVDLAPQLGFGGIHARVYFSNDAHPVFRGGTVPALSSCGTSPSAVVGTDAAGAFTVGSSATACTLTFYSAWTNAPHCFVMNETTVGSKDVRAIATTTTIVFDTLTTSDISSQKIHYLCVGNE